MRNNQQGPRLPRATMTTDYATGRQLYLDDQPLEACASQLARDGWLDAQEGIRRSAEAVDDSWEDG